MTEAYLLHEYAGFMYHVKIVDGKAVEAQPTNGQHPAANKDKHRKAAVETWNDEHP